MAHFLYRFPARKSLFESPGNGKCDIFPREFRNGFRLRHPPDRIGIAEDHELARILDRCKSPTPDFGAEDIPADKPLDIPHLATHNRTVPRGLAVEQTGEEDFRCREALHAAALGPQA